MPTATSSLAPPLLAASVICVDDASRHYSTRGEREQLEEFRNRAPYSDQSCSNRSCRRPFAWNSPAEIFRETPRNETLSRNHESPSNDAHLRSNSHGIHVSVFIVPIAPILSARSCSRSVYRSPDTPFSRAISSRATSTEKERRSHGLRD